MPMNGCLTMDMRFARMGRRRHCVTGANMTHNWKGTKVLVTGAGGFIGSHLAEALCEAGAQVRAMIRYNSRNDWGFVEDFSPELKKTTEVISSDIADPFAVEKAVEGCDTVFHLAALIGIPYSYVAPESYVRTNVTGVLNVLQAARKHGTRRVVQTSTSETYGTAQYTPIDEKHPLVGQSPYSASKIAADQMAISFFRSFELPVVILRPFNTFGPRQSARAVIPTIISQLLSHGSLSLGSLDPVRDFTFVKDTVRGFMAAGAAPRKAEGEVINIGTGSAVTIGETVSRISQLLDIETDVKTEQERVRPPKSEVMELVCNAEKAKQLMGWSAEVPLEEGLRQTIGYIRDHLDRYKPQIHNV